MPGGLARDCIGAINEELAWRMKMYEGKIYTHFEKNRHYLASNKDGNYFRSYLWRAGLFLSTGHAAYLLLALIK